MSRSHDHGAENMDKFSQYSGVLQITTLKTDIKSYTGKSEMASAHILRLRISRALI